MRHGGVPAEQVAFHWSDDQDGKILLYYNREFPALQQALDELGRKKATQQLVSLLTEDYKTHLRLTVVSENNTKYDFSSDETMKLLHRARADSLRAATLMLLSKVQQFGEALVPDRGSEDSGDLAAAA